MSLIEPGTDTGLNRGGAKDYAQSYGCSSTCRLLRTYEYFEVVCEGGDGTEAVANARKYQPDIILMDITMPIMNGLDATRGH